MRWRLSSAFGGKSDSDQGKSHRSGDNVAFFSNLPCQGAIHPRLLM